MATKKKSKPEASAPVVPPAPRCETCVFLHRGVACTVCGAKRAK